MYSIYSVDGHTTSIDKRSLISVQQSILINRFKIVHVLSKDLTNLLNG